mmetsp:Transcript_1777/g.2630  ORF Transcript_1777/g.2630 Transcript_1777/m.2630 type:complete len:93 (+) Transcript_1777:365-643(+)
MNTFYQNTIKLHMSHLFVVKDTCIRTHHSKAILKHGFHNSQITIQSEGAKSLEPKFNVVNCFSDANTSGMLGNLRKRRPPKLRVVILPSLSN